MAELFALDAAADLVDAAVGGGDEAKRVDDLGGGAGGDRLHTAVGVRHVEGAEAHPLRLAERLLDDEAIDGGGVAGAGCPSSGGRLQESFAPNAKIGLADLRQRSALSLHDPQSMVGRRGGRKSGGVTTGDPARGP